MYVNVIKRLMDILFGIIGLIPLIIAIIIVGPMIYLTDRGNIFYNAQRVGRNGKPFKMYKFRSMIINAPDIRLKDGSTYNSEDDPRVTKIGKIIRKTSIDELPQFINILKGDMSLIGPRPDTIDCVETYSERIKGFLKVRPGITGYNQAYFRNTVDGNTKLENDLYYAENCCLWLDVKIFFKTIEVVLKQDNVYKEKIDDVNILKELEKIKK